MDLPLLGHLTAEIVARSDDPAHRYFSNPDLAFDDQGLLLLWDTFGGDFAIHLARPRETGWAIVDEFPDSMHSHLIHLPEQGLHLVIGVNQRTRPRSLDLWWSADGDLWAGPIELFGSADFHAGSTPWAIHDGRLFVPFEIQNTGQWGSYTHGCVHAALTDDLRRPGSWTLVQQRVPWTIFPGCSHCGALEGNLVVAPDGELYNLLRIPAYNRLGRARWNGHSFDWLGLVQGVHNQSKPELFATSDGRWFCLANGWPARASSGAPHAQRNALGLWEATEPDLSRWRFVRVVASDHNPDHAFSYVAALIDPDDGLWIAERHGDDQTKSYHDTNCIAVRRKPEFGAWVEEPALVCYGTDAIGEGGEWAKTNAQDGLLLSHLDGALYPLRLTATVRLDEVPAQVGVLDLLGYATCDLVLIAGLQLVNQGAGAELALSTGGRRVTLRESVAAGETLRLTLDLLSPLRTEARVDEDTPVRARTHLTADPSLAGILPRADRPTETLGRITVVERPALAMGETACEAPGLDDLLILADGRGVTGPLAGNQPAPAENLAPGGPLVCGGHPGFFEPWAGGLMAGAGSAALWAPLDNVPAAFSCGGFGRVLAREGSWTTVLAALGERTAEVGLQRDRPYLALLLVVEEGGKPKLAVAWRTDEDRQMIVAPEPSESWLAYALTAAPSEAGLRVRVWAGSPGGTMAEAFATDVPVEAVGGARHWLHLIGQRGGEIRGSGGVWLTGSEVDEAVLGELTAAGFATKMDAWPAQRATCAMVLASEPEVSGSDGDEG